MSQTTRARWIASCSAAALVTVATGASGTQTKVWETATSADFGEGKFEGTKVDSSGELSMGTSTLRAELPGAAAVWSSLSLGDDTWIGTGNSGILYLLRDDRVAEAARMDTVLLSALATDGAGNIYAGTVPGGTIYRFDAKTLAADALSKAPVSVKWEPGHGKNSDTDKKKGKDDKPGKKDAAPPAAAAPAKDTAAPVEPAFPTPWAVLEGADQVWSLAWDPGRKALLAGTGPDGKVWSVDASGKASVLADTGDDHVLALAVEGGGSVLAGTSPAARMVRVKGPGLVETVWDFEGTEVKSIVLLPAGGKGEKAIVAAVNTFKNPPKFPAKMPSKQDLTQPSQGGNADAIRPPEGSGVVAAILPGGGYRTLLEDKQAYFTALEASDKTVRVASGSGGRVVEVDLEGLSTVILDVEERQVMTLGTLSKKPVLGTSDPAAVHRIQGAAPSDPLWISKVFDATFPARWGRLVLRGEGPVSWQARSGNVKEPDEAWSAWTAPVKSLEGDVGAPQARFLQMRLRVEAKARVWNAQVFYLQVNQQPIITEITVGGEGTAKSGGGPQGSPGSGPPQAGSIVDLRWKVTNPDDDPLRYSLWFSLEGEDQWISILEEGVFLTTPEYRWDAVSIPAGHYVIKVEADDGLVNDPSVALSHEKVSRSFLLDSDPPGVTLKASQAKDSVTFSGTATDGYSEIAKIEVSVDGSPWQALFPGDLVFDEPSETYEYTMEGLAKGPHTATARAYDRKGNGASAGVQFSVK